MPSSTVEKDLEWCIVIKDSFINNNKTIKAMKSEIEEKVHKLQRKNCTFWI